MLKALQGILSSNEREIKRLYQVVDLIHNHVEKYSGLALEEAPAFTEQFRIRLSQGETLDELLPEAFALVQEVSARTIGLRHFDVQFLGGIVLHQGRIAEMKTGEGKTLVATLPAYLNALEGRGVHIVTVNDYLAKRDRQWMGPIYEALGLRVGLILHDSNYEQRKTAYAADITYGTNNEFGFDYLRDNMAISLDQTVQRPLNYAIVDEVDSILIDEARTPLIISGPAEESTELYYKAAQIARRLTPEEDYTVDEKSRSVSLTPEGAHKVERYFGLDNLYGGENVEFLRHTLSALKAQRLYKNEVDYIVKDGEVIIVDEFTGRLMFGRRYSDGLHQAIEAKEGLRVREENQTLATITFQNYFRMYKKLAGMTGTAYTEEEEFRAIYKLPVVVIPTHKPMIRSDFPDKVFKGEKMKFKAIVEEIKDCHKIGRPVLVGTRSIEKSEVLSRMLAQQGIPHQVLNAKYHEKEAQIIALAGQKGAVTIATNMAGRGVDIVLQEGVAQIGGLHIIGTERHEARRIDNQLRGRSGRQGDPGSSRFYLSLEDELLRLFGGTMLSSIMERLRVPEDMPIEHSLLTKAIENAQKRVEAHNFEIRKQLLEFDDVLNKQREVVYSERRRVITAEHLRDHVHELLRQTVEEIFNLYLNVHGSREEWDLAGLQKAFQDLTNRKVALPEEVNRTEILKWAQDEIVKLYAARVNEIGEEFMPQVERFILLRVLDGKWKDHLYNMDFLKEGIGLRAYGQKSPLIEYQFEAFEMFQGMMRAAREDSAKFLFRVQLQKSPPTTSPSPRSIASQKPPRTEREQPRPMVVARKQSAEQVGRNDPCPCGSGLKYKKCHGKNQ